METVVGKEFVQQLKMLGHQLLVLLLLRS